MLAHLPQSLYRFLTQNSILLSEIRGSVMSALLIRTGRPRQVVNIRPLRPISLRPALAATREEAPSRNKKGAFGFIDVSSRTRHPPSRGCLVVDLLMSRRGRGRRGGQRPEIPACCIDSPGRKRQTQHKISHCKDIVGILHPLSTKM